MKKCTWCGKEYADDAMICSLDQQTLVPCSESVAITSEKSTGVDFPWHIVGFATAWLIANVLLFVFVHPAASLLFGLATALWAAIDCSQMQSHGSKVLGLAFKPVVVFAVCAFFLCGFGFIWYLVMRHRVRNAPRDLTQPSLNAPS
ncbi:MAG: hypothetical protein HZA90_20255 [Verrucomicrobia bacterium]|nr:hypothetical protein [Verrucomicrobiota bacterium]